MSGTCELAGLVRCKGAWEVVGRIGHRPFAVTGRCLVREVAEGWLIESVTVEIAAPPDVVWAVLTDYSRYPEWNPFTVRVETAFEVGSVIDLYLPDSRRPGHLLLNRECIRAIDAPHYLRYDTDGAQPGMHAVREQWVTDLGGGRSSYRTTDLFSGQHARQAFEAMGPWVKAGFDAVCLTLKGRCESPPVGGLGPVS
jgi:uncharacterized protein YndB with AHSA1/START domain